MSARRLEWPLLAPALLALASCAPPGGPDDGDIAAPVAELPSAPPAPPTARLTKPIVLHAKHATVHGRNARYEVGGGKDNIGFWTNAKDWVSWDFELASGSTFLVEIVYACPRGTDGTTYTVALGGKELTGKVEVTGSWTAFVTERLGVLGVNEPGQYTLSVTPVTKPGMAVMNLQSITLRPGRWERGLVAWWRFDEGWGEATTDALTETRDTVRFARWVRGSRETGLKFNGLSSSVTRAADRAPRLRKAFSIEAWAKLRGPPEGWCPIVNQHQYPLGYFFGLDGAGELGLHLAVGGRWLACTSSVRLLPNRWTHVAATFDERSGIAVYVNGSETGRLEVEGETVPAEEVDLLLGRHNHLPWSFNGALDEVRIFDRALEPEEIRRHYAAEKAEMGPLQRIVLKGVRPDRQTARAYERVTIEVDLEATYDNPFDASDVGVEAIVTTPSLRALKAPGFIYQPFERQLLEVEEELPDREWDEDGYADGVAPQLVFKEKLEPTGPPRWQVRLSFSEPGTHLVRVAAWDQTGRAMSDPLRIDVLPADAPDEPAPPEGPTVREQTGNPTYVPGIICRHGTDCRYFITDGGETFFPIGANVCWGGERGTFSYDEWLPRYARQGCNYFRVWLSPFWTTFAMNTAESGFDAIDLGNAWRLDHVLESAERLGLRAMLCIDSFNILRSTTWLHGRYEESPYARERGGPLRKPSDYFTHPRSLKAYRNRLRYLVARYGYSPGVFAWEFWNEVDIIDDYDSKAVARWHAEMARYLQQTDPWRHLITTSFAVPKGDRAVTALSELDFTQTHSYTAKDMAKDLGAQADARDIPGDRPHFFGEFGISASGEETARLDPTGIHLHNALYSCVGQGRAGTPMTWWWDLYVHENDLYAVFGSFARWVEGFDFVREKARRAELRVVCDQLVSERASVLEPVKGTWESAAFNRPLVARVDREGIMTFGTTPSDVLHGLGFHRKLHNPVTFELDVPGPTTFGIDVKGVSGYGDGILRISLDGKLVVEKEFRVPEGSKEEVITEYNGVYAIDLPEGRHKVEVANTGKDWISVAGYEVPWLKSVRLLDERLRAYGVAGEDTVLVWIQNSGHTWQRVGPQPSKTLRSRAAERSESGAASKIAVPTTSSVRGARLTVLGLAPGRWSVEHWDTRAGRVTKTEDATVVGDGELTVALPEVAWDAALRLHLEEPAATGRDEADDQE